MPEVNNDIRLSGIQRLSLRLMLMMAQRGIERTPNTDLFKMVEKNRTTSTYASNFRKSCHSLVDNGFLNLHRHPKTLKMSFSLTPLGLLTAADLEEEAQEQAKKEEEQDAQ